MARYTKARFAELEAQLQREIKLSYTKSLRFSRVPTNYGSSLDSEVRNALKTAENMALAYKATHGRSVNPGVALEWKIENLQRFRATRFVATRDKGHITRSEFEKGKREFLKPAKAREKLIANLEKAGVKIDGLPVRQAIMPATLAQQNAIPESEFPEHRYTASQIKQLAAQRAEERSGLKEHLTRWAFAGGLKTVAKMIDSMSLDLLYAIYKTDTAGGSIWKQMEMQSIARQLDSDATIVRDFLTQDGKPGPVSADEQNIINRFKAFGA